MYTIEFGPAAFRVFKKLPKEVQKKIASEAEVLRTNPLAGQPLEGKRRQFRSLRFSFQGTAYRLIYQVFAETRTIVVRLAGTRENIYRKLEEMGQ